MANFNSLAVTTAIVVNITLASLDGLILLMTNEVSCYTFVYTLQFTV